MSPFAIRLSEQATIVLPLATSVPFSTLPTLLADQCNGEHNCKSQPSAVVVVDATYNDFEGISATEVAIKLHCGQVSDGCHNVLMDRINMMSTFRDRKIFAS
ncbi:hypothetical protein ACFX11_008008 [Malus domestica]